MAFATSAVERSVLAAGQEIERRIHPAKSAFLARLMAWWGHGRSDSGFDDEAPLLLTERVPDDAPPPDQIAIAQWLWGPGYHTPGGEQHALDLVKPFALNPAMSMLDISAGLGGGPRAIAASFGTYVTGFECDPELARRGMEMSTLQGMQKRAPVTFYEPAKLELRAGGFDCILGREATYAVAKKKQFLETLGQSLKERGQLLLVEFVLESKGRDKPELAVWEGQQRVRPQLWTLAQYKECLTALGFETRVTEDTTDQYRRQILVGWAQMLHTVDLRGLPRAHMLAILDEAERWVHTISALDSGALRLYRIHALAGTGKPGKRASNKR
jgi:Methyltransferase domain